MPCCAVLCCPVLCCAVLCCAVVNLQRGLEQDEKNPLGVSEDDDEDPTPMNPTQQRRAQAVWNEMLHNVKPHTHALPTACLRLT